MSCRDADGAIRLLQRRHPPADRRAAHNGEVKSVAFSPDGTTLAGASADHTIRL